MRNGYLLKPYEGMSNAEVVAHIRSLGEDFDNEGYLALAERIAELEDKNRWIPISERMPTQEDGDDHGWLIVRELENQSPYRVYHAMLEWDTITRPDYFYTVTHWKRITP